MWKQWCGIGKNTDLQTDWYPVALSIHITTVGCFRTQDSWRRWIMVPCLEVPLSHTDSLWITGLLLQGVPPAACGSVQWIPHAPSKLESLFLCICGSKGWWKHGVVEALQLAQSSGTAAEGSDSPFFPPSLRVPKHTLCLAFIAKPLPTCPPQSLWGRGLSF